MKSIKTIQNKHYNSIRNYYYISLYVENPKSTYNIVQFLSNTSIIKISTNFKMKQKKHEWLFSQAISQIWQISLWNQFSTVCLIQDCYQCWMLCIGNPTSAELAEQSKKAEGCCSVAAASNGNQCYQNAVDLRSAFLIGGRYENVKENDQECLLEHFSS